MTGVGWACGRRKKEGDNDGGRSPGGGFQGSFWKPLCVFFGCGAQVISYKDSRHSGHDRGLIGQ